MVICHFPLYVAFAMSEVETLHFRVLTGCLDEQVCLDYWNSLVLELFDAHHNLDNPAVAANMMGLPVCWIFASYGFVF